MDSLNLNGIERDVFKFAYGVNNKKLYIKDLKKIKNSSLICHFLSDNKGLTIKWLVSFPKAKWDFEILSTNPNLTLEWLELFPKANWDFGIISSNLNLTLEWLATFPKANWDFVKLSSHPNLKVEWLESFPKEKWKFKILSSHPNLTIEWLERLPKANWDFVKLSSHPNLKVEWLKSFPKEKWKFKILSTNPNLTLGCLEIFPRAVWDFDKLSYHPNLTYKWLERFSKAKWNFKIIFERINLVKLQYLLINIPLLQYCNCTKNSKQERIICILLNNENFNYLVGYEKEDPVFLKLLDEERLDEKEINGAILAIKNKIIIKSYISKMYYNVFEHLYLQDLSGNIYKIYDWVESPNLLNLIRTTYPELGECDIYIEEQFLSKMSDNKFKKLMITYGTEAMIVYQTSLDKIIENPNKNLDLEEIEKGRFIRTNPSYISPKYFCEIDFTSRKLLSNIKNLIYVLLIKTISIILLENHFNIINLYSDMNNYTIQLGNLLTIHCYYTCISYITIHIKLKN